jgi:alpha-glucosidase
MDVIHCIGKDPALPDVIAERAIIPACALNDFESTHERLREIRKLVDAYPDERVMVGEVGVPWTEIVARYFDRGDELHLAFNFPPIFAPWEAAVWRAQIERAAAEFDPRSAWPTWALSNHDNRRHRTRYGSEARARAAALLLLGLRGTPFLYAGEEMGMEDAMVPPARVLDPGGRDGCRAPIPWEGGATHGWSTEEAWLPWPPEAELRNVAAQREDAGSILHLYRRLLRARRRSPALQKGAFAWLESPAGVLAWERATGEDRRIVLVNFSGQPARIKLPGAFRVEVASNGRGESAPFSGSLEPDAAFLLSPHAIRS